MVSQNLLGKLIWRPTNEHEFKLTGELFQRDTDVDQKYDLGFVNATTRQLSYQRHQLLSRQRGTFAHDWRPNFAFLDSVRWQVTHSPQEREFTGERLRSIASGTQQQRLDFLHKYGEVFTEFDSQFNSTIRLGPSVHRLTYGAYGNLTDTDYERRDITTNLTTGVVTVANAGGFNFANATTTRKDVFLQDEIELWSGKLRITPGFRYSTYKIDPRPDQFYIAVPGKEPREIEEGSLTKQVGSGLQARRHLLAVRPLCRRLQDADGATALYLAAAVRWHQQHHPESRSQARKREVLRSRTARTLPARVLQRQRVLRRLHQFHPEPGAGAKQRRRHQHQSFEGAAQGC